MSDMKLEIESNVPLPKSLPEIPFKEMKKGDSVRVPLNEVSHLNTLRMRVYRENQKKEARYSCHQVNDEEGYGLRIFRTA